MHNLLNVLRFGGYWLWALLAALLTLAALTLLSPDHALAQSVIVAEPSQGNAVVTVPAGSWVASVASGVQEVVVTLIMAVVAWTCRRFPRIAGSIVSGLITQQLVERAVSFGINTVVGATRGKELSFDVGSAVLANALRYFIETVPSWFIRWAGGEQVIRDHIIALIPLESAASLSSVTPTAPNETGPRVKVSAEKLV